MPRRNIVMGLGETGLSCARYLCARGESVTVVDNRTNPPAADRAAREVPNARLSLGRFDEELLADVERLIVSPGVSLDEPFVRHAMARGIPVCGDIELFATEVSSPVIAVTGSNGKSTVVSLVRDMLVEAGHAALAGGNLGPPALDLLLEERAGFYVLELSSFQLERTYSLSSAAAAVLNVSQDHLDRHNDLDRYAAAKARIYQKTGVAVVNRDDAIVAAMQTAEVPTTSFGLGAPEGRMQFGLRADDTRLMWLARGSELLMRVDELPLTGRHNHLNALAALALAGAVGVPMQAALNALRAFRGLPHRMQRVAERDGIEFIDDSKATNVGAASAAVDGLAGPLVLIAGGDGKGADFSALAAALTGKARASILIGRDAAILQTVFNAVCETHRAGDMNEAVRLAHRIAKRGDTVLLSPACASQDMFKDFAARGRAFQAAIGELSS